MGAETQLRCEGLLFGSARIRPAPRHSANAVPYPSPRRPIGRGRRSRTPAQETAKFPASHAHACIACTATMTDMAATRKFPPRAEVSPVRLSGQWSVCLATSRAHTRASRELYLPPGRPTWGRGAANMSRTSYPPGAGKDPGHRRRRSVPGAPHSCGQLRRTEVAGPTRPRSDRWPRPGEVQTPAWYA